MRPQHEDAYSCLKLQHLKGLGIQVMWISISQPGFDMMWLTHNLFWSKWNFGTKIDQTYLFEELWLMIVLDPFGTLMFFSHRTNAYAIWQIQTFRDKDLQNHPEHFPQRQNLGQLSSKERQETLCLWLDGCRHFAVLSMDGRRMVWADGDVWERAETIDPALQEAVKVQCGQWTWGSPKPF